MTESVDGRLARGLRTKSAILARAADIASADGLEGLSIGRLAQECGTSKSNIAAHFGSKVQLQIAAIDHAADVLATHVLTPTLAVQEGLPRLQAFYQHWMDYSRRRVFSGGCFFAAVTAEYDARAGVIRDVLRDRLSNWISLQQTLIREAQAAGEIRADVDPVQLAFELDAFALAANAQAVLHDDDAAYARAATAIASRIDIVRKVTRT
ncbi:TetR/AcrR family transcriptional regulator [Mycolicibacterium sp. P9-22]|nr:TetR/AcrR family transcriptional regulator [Mycolicibacterium sp. P9-22]